MELEDICDAIRNGWIRVSDHADEEASRDHLSLDEICFSVCHGEIIEDYPLDRPYPSCLVLGRTAGEDPLHSVWAFNSVNRWAVLITVYRPDPALWIDWKIRRKKS